MRLQEFANVEKKMKPSKLIRTEFEKLIIKNANQQELRPLKVERSSKKAINVVNFLNQRNSVVPIELAKKKPRPTTSKKPKTISQPKLPNAQKSVSTPKPTKPTKQSKKQLPPHAVKPQVLPLVFKNSTRSNTATPSQQSTTSQRQTSANTRQQRQKHDPDSVANIQRQLDPLAFDPTIKKLTS